VIRRMKQQYIIGSDECGTGSCVWSLIVCAVRAPIDWSIIGLNDSKKLTDKQRREVNEKLLKLVEAQEIEYAIAEGTSTDIDTNGLYPTLKTAYKQAIYTLYNEGDKVIIDGNMKFNGYLEMAYESVVKADTKIPAVMASSIIAKVYRDNALIKLSNDYPEYNFSSNKGYLSRTHIAAIKKYGLTPLHRKSYYIKALST
jgi:ribonuclease HII